MAKTNRVNLAAWVELLPRLDARLMDYTEPGYDPRDDPGRSGDHALLWPIAAVSGPEARRLVGKERNPPQAPQAGALEVLTRLQQSPENGAAVLWPPPTGGAQDHRLVSLRSLGRNRGIDFRVDHLPSGELMVALSTPTAPDAQPRLRVLTAIEADRLRRAAALSPVPGEDLSPLLPDVYRPEVSPARRRTPYRLYIRRLIEEVTNDPMARVVYPLNPDETLPRQQTRLHQEATRHGVRISLTRVDYRHQLIELVNYLPTYLHQDGFLRHERAELEERRRAELEAAPAEGGIVVTGTKE